jgi:glutaredoxin
VPCIKAWANNLGGINYPLLSDFWPHGEVALKYGVFRPNEGRSERALFVIDKHGVIQYIDIHDIDEQPDNETARDVIRRIDPVAARNEPQLFNPASQPLPHGGIVMYCSSWCPDCKEARLWLKERHLDFTEVDTYSTPGATEQVKKWADGNLTTPTFDIDGTIIVDFDRVKLAKVLKV